VSKQDLRKFARLVYERTKDMAWVVKGYSVKSPCIQVGPDAVDLAFHYWGGLPDGIFALDVIIRVNASTATPGGSYTRLNPWSWEKKLFWAIQKAADNGSTFIFPSRLDEILSSHEAAAKQAITNRRVLIETLESTRPPPGALSSPTEVQGGQLTLSEAEDKA